MRYLFLLLLVTNVAHAVGVHTKVYDYVEIKTDKRLPWAGRCPTTKEYLDFFSTPRGQVLWHYLDKRACQDVINELNKEWTAQWDIGHEEQKRKARKK